MYYLFIPNIGPWLTRTFHLHIVCNCVHVQCAIIPRICTMYTESLVASTGYRYRGTRASGSVESSRVCVYKIAATGNDNGFGQCRCCTHHSILLTTPQIRRYNSRVDSIHLRRSSNYTYFSSSSGSKDGTLRRRTCNFW